MAQVELPGAAVLEVQRLDVSQSGLLNLRLFQKAGDVLLQSLNIRQSTEVCFFPATDSTRYQHSGTVAEQCPACHDPQLKCCYCCYDLHDCDYPTQMMVQ